MPIDSQHPQYKARLPHWAKCRDAYEGEDAIKRKGEIYLPKLKGQSNDDYKMYKYRALFYGITAKSVQALVGMAASQEAEFKIPDEMRPYFENPVVNHFGELYNQSLGEVLLQSRFGVLVDYPEKGGDPYPATYLAEDIINWRENSDGELELVVLRELYDSAVDDYEVESKVRYRELRIVDGVYVQRIHDDDTAAYTEIVPKMPAELAGTIPFTLMHPLGLGFKDVKPMMLDIANINISHYLSSADLEHGRHFTGLPTPVVIGANADTDLYIGSTKFIVIPDKGGDAKYLEFTGQGLESLEKAMSEKLGLLASMSARLLDNSSRGSEAADAVQMRYASETASLTSIVKAIEMGLNRVYSQIAKMMRLSDDVKINLSTEFLETPLSASEMSSLFDGYFKRAISIETLVYNLRKGRRIDPDRSDADEVKAIKDAIHAARTNPELTKPENKNGLEIPNRND